MCIRDRLLYPKVIGSPFGAAGLDSVLNEIANIRANKEATKTLNFLNIFEKILRTINTQEKANLKL